ncbi:MAG: sigma-70 family RNA polymerase sigma factor [Acidimicrobiia bacterium]|nr:sigma-70 family RNA polymerase sigma factor [Acidimicrobiia bacterium]
MLSLAKEAVDTVPDKQNSGAQTLEPSDANLVVAVARFDQTALSQLYDRHGTSVFALARRLVKSRELAEEVTQEIFMRLWNRPERFDSARGALRSFLLADTHGRSIDMLRSELARKEREKKEHVMDVRHTADVESQVWSNVASEEIREAVAGLADGERKAIELAYFSGYTYRQVAEALGEPEGTVKSRIRTGMKRLKGQLTASGMMP